MALSRGSRWFLAFGALGVAAVAASLWWLDGTLFDDGIEAGVPVEYTVARGQSVASVGEKLAELGVVRSAFRFRTAADEAGLAQRLQPGLFELETGMSIEAAIDVLAAGPIAPPSIRFTVVEGLTLAQTLERLAAQFPAYEVADFRAVLDDQLDAMRAAAEAAETDAAPPRAPLDLPAWWPHPDDLGEVREPFEGLLWPQTYEVDDDARPARVLQTMVSQLAREMEQVPAELRQAAAAAGRDEHTTLVLASLVERETRVAAERERVAGVIVGRLADGTRLQIDATVVYALGEDATQIVTLDQLEVDGPHNTYRVAGLPPTPIAGVGTASLRAAFSPAETDERFYVLAVSCDGSHVFAVTLAEHDANVAAFRDAGRCLEADEDGDLVLDGTQEGIEGASG